MDHSNVKQAGRPVPAHNTSSSRDIIISTDRLLEAALKGKLHTLLTLVLIVAATVKHLQDFFGFSASSLHVVIDNVKHA